MALFKEKTLDTEISGDYWKIDRVEIGFDKNPYTVVWLGLYKNKATRNRNKNPIHTEVKRYGETLNTRNEIYVKIKESQMVKVIDVPQIKNFITGEITQAEVSHLEETNWFVDATDV